MSIINKSKMAFVVLFGMTTINAQLFAAEKLSQKQTFVSKVNFYVAAILIGVTSILAASPIDIDLDEVSKANLITQVKKENVARRYWPEQSEVRLKRFYVTEGLNNQPKYCCRSVGYYEAFVDVEIRPGETVRLPAMLGKPTEGCFFSETELETFGVILPEQLRGLRYFEELNKIGNKS